jgi:hypothetical protein
MKINDFNFSKIFPAIVLVRIFVAKRRLNVLAAPQVHIQMQ